MSSKEVIKRRSITLQEKLDIIKAHESKSLREISKDFNVHPSTICKIIKEKDKFLSLPSTKFNLKKKRIRVQDEDLRETEDKLKNWIDINTGYNIPLSQQIIQAKALDIHAKIREERQEEALSQEKPFAASNGWFSGFVERKGLHNIKVKGEAGSADKEAAQQFIPELSKIIQDGKYPPSCIFNADETGLCFKKMPSRSFIAKEERSLPGPKAAKDRVTILFGGNADGTLKLMPLLIHKYQNPRAMKNCSKEALPVIYRWQRRAWMTGVIFTDWFKNHFKPEVEKFCHDRDIPFKILLLLDNAPCHPKEICGMFPEISVVFFPPNTTSLIQPMDQGAISNFKAYYLRNTFSLAIMAIDASTDKDEDKATAMRQFWRQFSILDVIQVTAISWQDVTETAMSGVWNRLLKTENDAAHEVQTDISSEIAKMGQYFDPGINEADVRNLLASHNVPLNDEDIDELCQIEKEEGKVSEDPAEDSKPFPRSAAIREQLLRIEREIDKLMLLDLDFERSVPMNKKFKEHLDVYHSTI
ncbi:tigger transposable element-derived protein 1 [Sergentomyia squamirostris]